MRKFSYFVFMLVLLLTISCESPMKVETHELADVTQSQFDRAPLKNGGDFSIGYDEGNIQTSQVNLTWTRTTEEDFKFYQLYRNNQQIAVFNDISHTSYTDSLLSENTSYDYKINVVVETGMTATDTLEIKTAQWAAPSNVQINAYSNTVVLLTWQDNSDSEEYFKIFKSTFAGIIDSVIVDANTTELLVTDLDSTLTYYFTIEAESPWEEGIVSSYPESINMYDLYLDAPSNLHGNLNADFSVDLYWYDNANLENGYCIERKINNGEFVEIENIDQPNIVEYTDNDASYWDIGDVLVYRVRAYNNYGDDFDYTEYSNEFQIEITEITINTIHIELSVDYYYYEARWNIVNQQTWTTIFPDYQTFSYSNQQVSIQLDLEPGWYYVHCIDDDWDGGISGTVYQGDNILVNWNNYNYDSVGYFEFYVNGN
ncbi:fibronectin type III domain-containing protein [bacterium]|nr:fibronectin type III domain-containing protein [bacterium]